MNPYSDLKALVVEVRGTESAAMKQIAAVTARIKAKKARIERGQSCSKGKK